jgi:hypothetical protein
VAFFRESDLTAQFRLMGQDVTVGAETVKGFFDEPDEELLAQDPAVVIGRDYVVRVPTKAFSSIAIGTEITTGGVTYKVFKFLQTWDGAVRRILCSKV